MTALPPEGRHVLYCMRMLCCVFCCPITAAYAAGGGQHEEHVSIDLQVQCMTAGQEKDEQIRHEK